MQCWREAIKRSQCKQCNGILIQQRVVLAELRRRFFNAFVPPCDARRAWGKIRQLAPFPHGCFGYRASGCFCKTAGENGVVGHVLINAFQHHRQCNSLRGDFGLSGLCGCLYDLRKQERCGSSLRVSWAECRGREVCHASAEARMDDNWSEP